MKEILRTNGFMDIFRGYDNRFICFQLTLFIVRYIIFSCDLY